MNISIKYTRLFIPGTLNINVPEKFQELSGKQFKYVALYFLKKIDDRKFISLFYGIRKRLVNKFSAFHIYRLLNCVGFISNSKNPVDRFFIDRIPGTDLVAPLSRLKDVSLLQYMYIDKMFNAFSDTGKDDYLRSFIAGIYLPKKPARNREELKKRLSAFDTVNIDKSSRLIEKNTDESFRFAIFLNFIYIREWLSVRFPFVFSSGSGEDNKPDKNKQSSSWISIFDSFVGDDIVNSSYYEQMPCVDAFRLIDNRIKKYRKYAK